MNALISLLALVAAQGAPEPVRVGVWLVGPMDADHCQAETRFGDHHIVNISENSYGIGHFVLGDDRWLLKDGDIKPGTISWDGWKTSQEVTLNAVKAGNGGSYLVMETDGGFTENLSGTKHFWLRVPGVEFDNDFEIPDATDVVTAIATCNSKL